MDEMTIVILVFGGVSIITIILGLLIKKYKMVDIISFYNHKKDDKEIISRLVGDNFILLGTVFLIGLSLLYFEIFSAKSYTIFFLLNTILIIINIYSRMLRYRKKKS